MIMLQRRTIIALVASIIIVIIVILGVIANKKNKTTTPKTEESAITELDNMKPLAPVNEVDLQHQLQNILAKGKESDCAALSDSRYQYACRDFFKNMKK